MKFLNILLQQKNRVKDLRWDVNELLFNFHFSIIAISFKCGHFYVIKTIRYIYIYIYIYIYETFRFIYNLYS